jgi:hypothetical protein
MRARLKDLELTSEDWYDVGRILNPVCGTQPFTNPANHDRTINVERQSSSTR